MKLPANRGVAIVIAVLVAVIVAIAAIDTGDDTSSTPPTVTTKVDGVDHDHARDDTIVVPKVAVDQTAPVLEDQLRQPPAGAPAKQLQEAERAADQIRQTQAPLPAAGASAGIPGCRTSFVRNQSSRHGVRPQLQVLHYTVSPNRAGWSDVDAVVALFNRSSSQASSNFVIDGEGHCAYIVPLEAKAWTQAGANPFAVSYEIINTGHESVYLAAAGYAKLRAVMRVVSQRTGIPMRAGRNSGCSPARSGIVQHKDFGICGGGHVDIAPFAKASVIARLVAGGAKPVTSTDRTTCRKINWWRAHGRAHGQAEQNAIRRRRALAARHVTCTTHGPVRR